MGELSDEWRELLRCFQSRGVEYVVVGAIARSLYGLARYTKDMDLYVRPTAENAARVTAALDEFGFGGVGLSESDFMTPGSFVRLGREPWSVDLLTRIPGVDWEEVEAGKLTVEIEGVCVRVIGKAEFIRNKKASGRLQDLADAEAVDEQALLDDQARRRRERNGP